LEVEIGVPIIVVDYSNAEALTKILEGNNVHTIESAINMLPIKGVKQEIELIGTADASMTTKRIVVSGWFVTVRADHQGGVCTFSNPIRRTREYRSNANLPSRDEKRMGTVVTRRQSHAELRQTKNLEYTRFFAGFSLDYWCEPVVHSHMSPFTVVLDIPHNTAAIPGSGEISAVFTHSTDLARDVAAILDVEEWDTSYYVIGDKFT